MNSYKEWLDNEYAQWVKALQESTPYNFKEHPVVKRMLSIGMEFPVPSLTDLPVATVDLLIKIDNIGYKEFFPVIPGDCSRMIYYARKILKINPPSIIEIGGGAGEFYAILRALGYKGNYFIQDLPEVMLFQNAYLRAVHYETKLQLGQTLHFDFCVSFYALGEFDDETKDWCIEMIVKKCPHGFIVWNPHSGASPEVNFPFAYNIQDETPLLSEGNKQIEW